MIFLIVAILGIQGKMGSFINYVLNNRLNYEVVAGIDRKKEFSNLKIYEDLSTLLENHKIDLLVDFSNKDISYETIKLALQNNIKVISGTTGYSKNELLELKSYCNKDNSFIYTPNFCIGSAVMYDICEKIYHNFNSKDIVESHNNKKKDAPSGTARELADLLNIDLNDVQSLRLNDIIGAHDVIFNNKGEKLIIRHEVYHKDAFLKGFLTCLDKLEKNNFIVIGLKEYFNFIGR